MYIISFDFGEGGVWKLGIIDVAGSFCVGFLLLRLYAWFMKKQGDQEKTGWTWQE